MYNTNVQTGAMFFMLRSYDAKKRDLGRTNYVAGSKKCVGDKIYVGGHKKGKGTNKLPDGHRKRQKIRRVGPWKNKNILIKLVQLDHMTFILRNR